MKQTVIRYGLYSAATISVLFLGTWLLLQNVDYGLQEVLGYLSIVLSLLFVFFGIKHYRDHENQGKLTFGKALLVGMLISLITALAFGILDVVYAKYINPDFFQEYMGYMQEQLAEEYSGEALEQQVKELKASMEGFQNPVISFLVMSSTVLIIGFIISLLSAVFLQRK